MNDSLTRRDAPSSLPIPPPPPPPDSISGWIKFFTTFSALLVARELRLQRILSSPPVIFVQQSKDTTHHNTSELTPALRLTKRLTEQSTTHSTEPQALSRNIKPSVFFTSSVGASLGAYLHRGPSDPRHEASFREYFKIGSDGSILALDWEVPLALLQNSTTGRTEDGVNISSIKHMLLHGPITLSIPIIIILHGINNDSSFGYIRSLQRLCTDRGWITCAMNFRGCGVPNKNKQDTTKHQDVGLQSPRAYHAGYTNDLRTVVNCIVDRCNRGRSNSDTSRGKDDLPMTPIFLVGNSLGANIMTKYLGEEGIDSTLPPNVLAGISRGNPLEINGEKIHSPWAQILSMGVKKTLFLHKKNRQAITTMMMNDVHFQKAIWKALFSSSTIGTWDQIMAPFMVRNEPIYPFTNKIGFHDGEEYWSDSSSRKYIANVSVPLLVLSSLDDFLVSHSALRSLNQCLSNPNVMVVKTKAGGHLGWQEAAHDRYFGTSSFADAATVEFITAVLEDSNVPNLRRPIIHSRL
jgi:predicted alpha/beta-fold hydrolase